MPFSRGSPQTRDQIQDSCIVGRFFTTWATREAHSPQSVSSVAQSVVSDSLWPHELQHARPPCPSPTPGVYSNPCPSSQWCHPTLLLHLKKKNTFILHILHHYWSTFSTQVCFGLSGSFFQKNTCSFHEGFQWKKFFVTTVAPLPHLGENKISSERWAELSVTVPSCTGASLSSLFDHRRIIPPPCFFILKCLKGHPQASSHLPALSSHPQSAFTSLNFQGSHRSSWPCPAMSLSSFMYFSCGVWG